MHLLSVIAGSAEHKPLSAILHQHKCRIGDDYLAYNKPYGMMSWLQDAKPVGDYFLVVDADMTFHRYMLLLGSLWHSSRTPIWPGL